MGEAPKIVITGTPFLPTSIAGCQLWLDAADQTTITGTTTMTSWRAAYTGVASVGGSYSISVGTWYHAVIILNGTSLSLYVNGSQVGSTITGNPSINGIMIGQVSDGSYYTYAGYLDDYRIYNRVLTGTEIGQIYAGTG